jgi:hypothetical protein
LKNKGLWVTPVACGFESRHEALKDWKQTTLFDFIPTARSLLITTQAIDEVVGILVYWIVGKL